VDSLGGRANENRSLLSLWFSRPLWMRLLFVLLSAALVLLAGYGCGRAGDCAPGQRDGQCGLSTFMGILAGGAGAGLVLIVGLIGTIGHWFWRRAKDKTEKQGSNQ
jgi:hypothetical protein